MKRKARDNHPLSQRERWPPGPVRGLLLLLFLSACRTPGHRDLFILPDYNQSKPRTVAVLLFDNQTVDLLAPEMLRTMAKNHLQRRGYQGPALPAVDAKLHDQGVSDGGQLRALKPAELGKLLNVDALLYGYIEDFQFADIGFGMRKNVRVRLTLVRAEDGERLWQDEESESKLQIRESKEEAEHGVIDTTVEKAVANMQKRPLYEQSRIVMDRLFDTLPAR